MFEAILRLVVQRCCVAYLTAVATCTQNIHKKLDRLFNFGKYYGHHSKILNGLRGYQCILLHQKECIPQRLGYGVYGVQYSMICSSTKRFQQNVQVWSMSCDMQRPLMFLLFIFCYCGTTSCQDNENLLSAFLNLLISEPMQGSIRNIGNLEGSRLNLFGLCPITNLKF